MTSPTDLDALYHTLRQLRDEIVDALARKERPQGAAQPKALHGAYAPYAGHGRPERAGDCALDCSVTSLSPPAAGGAEPSAAFSEITHAGPVAEAPSSLAAPGTSGRDADAPLSGDAPPAAGVDASAAEHIAALPPDGAWPEIMDLSLMRASVAGTFGDWCDRNGHTPREARERIRVLTDGGRLSGRQVLAALDAR